MALARVQASAKATASASASITFAMATPPTVGNGLIVFANGWGAASSLTTCTDNRGNSYTLAVTRKSGDSNTGIFLCAAVTGTGAPFQITVNSAPSSFYWVTQAVEISGVGTGLVVDQTAGATGTSAAPATGATAALTGTDVVQAALHAISAAQASITVGIVAPVWTQEFEELPFSFIAGEADTRIVTGATGTTPSAAWTDTGSGVWAAVIAVFKTATPAAVARAQAYVWGPL